MTIAREQNFKEKTLEAVAEKMCLAARTAPKTRGIDQLDLAVVRGADVSALREKMNEIGEANNIAFFVRDAKCLAESSVIVLLGTKLASLNVPSCGFCGYENCAEREKTSAACALAAGDLGIALGSALSAAADSRADNRLMFSIGKAAIELGIFDKDVKIAFGIPLSATGKNPFFDRKT